MYTSLYYMCCYLSWSEGITRVRLPAPLIRALLDYVARYKFIYVCMYVCHYVSWSELVIVSFSSSNL